MDWLKLLAGIYFSPNDAGGSGDSAAAEGADSESEVQLDPESLKNLQGILKRRGVKESNTDATSVIKALLDEWHDEMKGRGAERRKRQELEAQLHKGTPPAADNGNGSGKSALGTLKVLVDAGLLEAEMLDLAALEPEQLKGTLTLAKIIAGKQAAEAPVKPAAKSRAKSEPAADAEEDDEEPEDEEDDEAGEVQISQRQLKALLKGKGFGADVGGKPQSAGAPPQKKKSMLDKLMPNRNSPDAQRLARMKEAADANSAVRR
jgi:hypothetical protein